MWAPGLWTFTPARFIKTLQECISASGDDVAELLNDRFLVGFSELGLSVRPGLILHRDPALFTDLPQLHRDAQSCGGAPARQFYYHRFAIVEKGALGLAPEFFIDRDHRRLH
jgi:hypothetical protein